MDLELKGKIIIVTGGSKGIGYGICERLVQEATPSREVFVLIPDPDPNPDPDANPDANRLRRGVCADPCAEASP